MKTSWQYVNPTHLLVGGDRLSELSNRLLQLDPHKKPVALLTGKSAAKKYGFTEQVLAHLHGWDVRVFDQIEPEPSHATVTAGARFIENAEAGSIVALGGGSVIDAAKAISCIAHSDLEIREIMDRERVVENRSIRLVAIPTTAGTGSEVTPYSVITNEHKHVKQSLASYWFYPNVSFLVPEFVQTSPRKVIADVGIDSLAHAFEALWSIHSNPFSDALAFDAIQQIARYLPAYHVTPTDPEASAGMQIAASMAGKAFSNTFTAACHALSFPIGAEFGLTHGHSCAMTLWLIADVNAGAVADKFDYLAKMLSLNSGADVPGFIRDLRDRVHEVTRFGQLGASEQQLHRVAEGAFRPLLANNPVSLDTGDLVELLHRAM